MAAPVHRVRQTPARASAHARTGEGLAGRKNLTVEAHKLVKMANEIAAFFHAEPDQAVAIEGVASHLRRFWDPRMRRERVRGMEEHDGEGVTERARAGGKTPPRG